MAPFYWSSLFIWLFLAMFFGANANLGVPKIKIGIVSSAGSPWRKTILEAYRRLTSKYEINEHLITIQTFEFEEKNGIKRANSLDQICLAHCNLLSRVMKNFRKQNVSVVIGPFIELVRDVAESANIPYIVVDEQTVKNDKNAHGNDDQYVYKLMPSQFNVLKTTVEDIIRKHNWAEVTVIYDDLHGLALIGYLLTNMPDIKIHLTHFTRDLTTEELRQRLIYVRQQKTRNIIVTCGHESVSSILETAMSLSMLTHHYKWVYATMDPDKADLSEFADSDVNMTSFRLNQHPTTQKNPTGFIRSRSKLERAIAEDALYIAKSMYNSARKRFGCTTSENCWISGENLNKMPINFVGKTGHIEFDSAKTRTNLTLDVVGLNSTGLKAKGKWIQSGNDFDDRLKLIPYKPQITLSTRQNPLGKGTYAKVVTILEKPFVMLKQGHQYMKGNDKFEGYLVDMLHEISEIIGFKYELYQVPDGKFGSRDDEGNWNGIVHELISGNATMSLATMSISVEREHAIDFTKPFEDLYITILLRRPQKENYLLQFLDPLHYLVWILILVALLATSILMLIIDKLVPNNGDDPTGPRYNLKESLWFFYGSLVQAGSETTPKTYSGRVLGSAWWFFSLILISSYTANLAAFLTVIKISSPIKEIPDLGNQNKIRYGTVKNSRTADFFRQSSSEVLRKMWIQMSQVYPDSMVDTSHDGVDKVLSENYAFLWDLPVNMFTATKLCDTMVVGGPFDRKHYGIGVPRGAAYRDDLTMAILRLNEQGKLSTLKKKWWSTSKCGDPRAIESSSTTTELEIGNVAGVFIVLSCGVTLALILAFLERAFLKFQRRRKHCKDGGKISPTKSSRLMNRTTSSSDSENYITNMYGNLISTETPL